MHLTLIDIDVRIIHDTLMIVNMMVVKMWSVLSILVNMISHHGGVAQMLLAVSGEPLTTMKKALFHGRLRVFGQWL